MADEGLKDSDNTELKQSDRSVRDLLIIIMKQLISNLIYIYQ